MFLTPHGVKLPTSPGAPEQAEYLPVRSPADAQRNGVHPTLHAARKGDGRALDARCDLFAAGAILFEMLAAGRVRRAHGRRCPPRDTHENPPALTGSPDCRRAIE